MLYSMGFPWNVKWVLSLSPITSTGESSVRRLISTLPFEGTGEDGVWILERKNLEHTFLCDWVLPSPRFSFPKDGPLGLVDKFHSTIVHNTSWPLSTYKKRLSWGSTSEERHRSAGLPPKSLTLEYVGGEHILKLFLRESSAINVSQRQKISLEQLGRLLGSCGAQLLLVAASPMSIELEELHFHGLKK